MSALVRAAMPHLIVVPILLPMVAAAAMLLLGEGRRPVKVAIGMASALAGLFVSCLLLSWSDTHGVVAYLPGNWRPPFGIALAMDRLSATMLVLAWTLGAAALLFASARWQRAGIHFHALLQLELMGLSGAFLTADVFNLFVFFEILLAASYGLLLHGSGRHRVRASVRYVAVNLSGSSLFLLGAAIIYGVTGTLNMAELSARLSGAAVENRHLVYTGAAILSLAFLLKAGAWPLNFWLSPAYSSATPPVAALFAILTEVGVYALIRLWTLMFAGGPLAGFGADAVLAFGVVTVLLASFGVLASQSASVQASWAVVVSAGTILSALGMRDAGVLGSGLFYLVPSTLASGALFLLVDVVRRWQAGGTVVDEAPFLNAALETEDLNLDDEGAPLVTLPFPASTALLALAFLTCALLLAGLPPLPTFLGKAGMLSAAIGPLAAHANGSGRAWIFVATLLASGLVVLLALMRTGIRTFWTEDAQRERPRVRAAEGLPLVALLGITAALVVAAGPAMEFANDAARSLFDRTSYIEAVLGARVRPSPTPVAR
ncbi:MAG TPA: monovalent cation/H+ antiporter subunit D [Myxococcales bacterium]|nr:monovalent cation/H+ antiporter subunit D [Myxococcales bacterium]